MTYFGGILLPAIGVAGIAAGSQPGYAVWFRYGGIGLVCVAALLTLLLLCSWWMSRLCITPTTLTVRLPRDCVA